MTNAKKNHSLVGLLEFFFFFTTSEPVLCKALPSSSAHSNSKIQITNKDDT